MEILDNRSNDKITDAGIVHIEHGGSSTEITLASGFTIVVAAYELSEIVGKQEE